MAETKKSAGNKPSDKDKQVKDAKKDVGLPEEELNEEDQILKDKLELLVDRLSDRQQQQRSHALDELKTEITSATKTMTSVPKPLKFLTPLYPKVVAAYEAETDAGLKVSDLSRLINGQTINQNFD